MALDLTVNETPFEDEDMANPSNCVLLYSEAITIPGTNDILFEVSPSGKLILANFTIERRNGSYFLKRYGGDTPVSSFSSEHPTNLSVDKTTVQHEDGKQNFSVAFHGGEFSSVGPRSTTGEPEHWMIALDATDSMPQNLSTVGHGTWRASQEENVEHAQVEDLSVAEKPVDATLPRTQMTGVRSSPMDIPSKSQDDEDSGVMSQFVKTLLKEHESLNAGSSSDVIVRGNNLSELQRFVKRLKAYRHSAGLSQYQLSCELARHYDQQTMFSQSLLSRFELLGVTVRAAFRLFPYLKNWLEHAEQGRSNSVTPSVSLSSTCTSDDLPVPVRALGKARLATLVRLGYPPGYQNGTSTPTSHSPPITMIGSDDARSFHNQASESSSLPACPAAKSHSECLNHEDPGSDCRLVDPETRLCRRERTHFTIATRAILAAAYEKNPRPKGQELTRLAMETGHNRESIRIWFCNRRQLTNPAKNRKAVTT